MKRDSNKIDSIAVDAVSQETNQHDLLHPDLNKGDKRPFFDGHILVYKGKNQTNENYLDRIPVQIKGQEVKSFSKTPCRYRPVKKSALEAYRNESGILFFVVEILKGGNETKIFWKQMLPYDISLLIEQMKRKKRKEKRTNSTTIILNCLEKTDLTLVCQNFIVNRAKQKHGLIKTLDTIKGVDELSISAITGFFGKGNQALNDYITAKNPLYVYAKDQNDVSFPIANLIGDKIRVMLHDSSEVWVDEIPYGDHYFSHQINENGYYYQFGLSWRFFQDGQTTFSATGTLNERIRDIGFLLKVVEGGGIRIGHDNFLYKPQISPEQNDSIHKIIRSLEILQEIKCVFDFLGMTLPVDITVFRERDWHILELLSEHVVYGKECPALFRDDGIKILWIGKYPFLVLADQKKIVNVFCSDYYKSIEIVLEMYDGTRKNVSPYYCLDSETIAKSANFNGEVVMESIKEYLYFPSVGFWYNNLLLEAIKAVDIDPKNKRIIKFSNDLADYLLENEDNLVHRLNKIQIHKRLTPLEKQGTDWLLAERDKQDDSKILCGIAILLDDTTLFDEQFAKLTQAQQEEFQTYPIMKLLNRNVN